VDRFIKIGPHFAEAKEQVSHPWFYPNLKVKFEASVLGDTLQLFSL
jgi:hypothetical protein